MIPEEDLAIIIQVAKRYRGLPGVELEDLIQEGKIAWLDNYHKRHTYNWPGLLSSCVSRHIQRNVLGYSFQMPWYVVFLTRRLHGSTEEQVAELSKRIQNFQVTAAKLPKQVERYNKKGIDITIEQLATYKAKEMLRDASNMRSLVFLEEDEDGS